MDKRTESGRRLRGRRRRLASEATIGLVEQLGRDRQIHPGGIDAGAIPLEQGPCGKRMAKPMRARRRDAGGDD
jgi:hypothetical protein